MRKNIFHTMDSSHKGSIMQKFDVSFRRHWISCWTNGQWLKTLRSSCDVTVIHQPFLLWLLVLTHWGRVTHIRVSNLTIIGSDNGLSPRSAPTRYLNQWWNIVNWTLRNKLQWNFNRNSNIFINKNAFEDVVCEMVSILSRPQCVKVRWEIDFTKQLPC